MNIRFFISFQHSSQNFIWSKSEDNLSWFLDLESNVLLEILCHKIFLFLWFEGKHLKIREILNYWWLKNKLFDTRAWFSMSRKQEAEFYSKLQRHVVLKKGKGLDNLFSGSLTKIKVFFISVLSVQAKTFFLVRRVRLKLLFVSVLLCLYASVANYILRNVMCYFNFSISSLVMYEAVWRLFVRIKKTAEIGSSFSS